MLSGVNIYNKIHTKNLTLISHLAKYYLFLDLNTEIKDRVSRRDSYNISQPFLSPSVTKRVVGLGSVVYLDVFGLILTEL
jgi:hypothetical protein